MELVSPVGKAVHTGTYNAHLIPIMAGLAFLETAADPGFYPRLLGLSDRLCRGLRRAFAEAKLPVRVQWVGARFAMYFGLDPNAEVTRYRQAAALDWEMMSAFCREMHERGVYVNPAWHHGLSAVHTEDLVDEVVEKAAAAARVVAG
jgi:glutamate-1-semialdehyde 2,1-aminomutase